MARNGHTKKTAKTVESIEDDLQSLRGDVTHLSKQLQTLLRDAGSDAVDDVMSRLSRARATVDDLIADAGSKGKEAARVVVNMKDNFVDCVEDSVRERPLAALAIAAGVGFILSSTLRR
ncbi:MAG: DUF883 family protein [Xanthobacteraceae bacterium]